MNVRSAAVWVLSAGFRGSGTDNFVSYSSLLVSIIAKVVIHNIYCSPSICTGFLQASAQPPKWETKAVIAPNKMDLYLGWSIDVSDDTLISGSWRVPCYWNAISNEFECEQLPGSATVFVRTSTIGNSKANHW
jgi:hypothetical protein